MLTQSTLSALQAPLGQGSVFDPPCEGRWSGLGVAIRSGMVPFLQSLDPGYQPSNTRHQTVNGPAFALGFAEDSGFLQGVELAARLVSPCAGLPEYVTSVLGSVLSASAALRFAWDQWAAMSDSASEGELTDRPDKHDKEKAEKVPANARQRAGKPTAADTVGRTQLPTVAVVLGGMSCLTPAAAQSVIEVADVETLGKIGRDPSYRLNDHYRQSSDIDGGKLSQSIGNHSHPFTGQYDGQCHTIANLQRCLVQTLKDGGRVDSLRFTGANINSTETAGVVSCEILDDALASNIQVEDAFVATRGEEKFAGIGAGYVSGAVTNITVVNGTVMTSGAKAHAGISAGKLEGKDSAVTGTGALNCKVLVIGEEADAGVGAGQVVMGGAVNHTTAAHSRVEVNKNGAGAIGAGRARGIEIRGKYIIKRATVMHTTAAYCQVRSGGSRGSVGIGAGNARSAAVTDTIAAFCEVDAGRGEAAGIGVGYNYFGLVTNSVGVNSNLKNVDGPVGVGVGYGRVGSIANTTGLNCTLLSTGTGTHAGIGAGSLERATVDKTTGVDCKVLTIGTKSFAGIGLGLADFSHAIANVTNTTSVHCEIATSGSDSDAGIGAGYVSIGGVVLGTTALSSKVLVKGSGQIGIGAGNNARASVYYSRAIDCTLEDSSGRTAINWGEYTDLCNVRVNDNRVRDTPFGCEFPLDNLCKHAAPGLVDADCKPNNRLLMDIHQALKNLDYSHPLQPDFLNPQQVAQFGVCWTKAPIPIDNTVPVNISAPCCLPATAAPLANGLSGVAVAGIALGAVAACALVAGGAYVYHRYNRSDNSEGKEPVSPKDSEPSRLYDTIPT